MKKFLLLMLLGFNCSYFYAQEEGSSVTKKQKKKKKKVEFSPQKEGALLISSVAQIVGSDQDDTDNILAAILQMVGILFRLIMFVETDEECTRSVVCEPETLEIFVHSFTEIVYKLNLTESDKRYILNRVREEIVDLYVASYDSDPNNKIEFCIYAE